MNAANRAKAIFLQALEIASRAERMALVVRECGGDDELRQQVEGLLAAHGASDSFLEKPAAALAQTIDALASPTVGGEQPGLRIGPYKLLERIGEGGMGTVWMAKQEEPVRRTVALKLIKPGMDSRAVLARFEAERQALAVMDHPNIAKVLDAGTTSCEPGGVTPGRPYFVMELVKGTPITTFCDEGRLPTRDRLALFVAVCQAIQHAHQKGVIHRDIKPSNVLVALYDDKPVPKVIDFGIAKAAGHLLTEKTLQTGFGAIIGTPEYMSPEQATFNQLDIDTRSDVYSLGVLLYELLTGTTPLDRTRFKDAALLEVLRVVREEDPPRPSMKLSTSQARASIAATRGAEFERLAKELRGELDWIVMKSLEKDRGRRYESAASLGQDVQRYLQDELVEARPPSAWYRLRKATRRHRTSVLVTLLLLVAGTVAGAFAYRAVQADRGRREEAERAAFARREDALREAHLEITQAGRLGRIREAEIALKNAESFGVASHHLRRLREQLEVERAKRNRLEENSEYWRYPNASRTGGGVGGVDTTPDSMDKVIAWYEKRIERKIEVDSSDGGGAGGPEVFLFSIGDSHQTKLKKDGSGYLLRPVKIGVASRHSDVSSVTIVINRVEGEDVTHIIWTFFKR